MWTCSTPQRNQEMEETETHSITGGSRALQAQWPQRDALGQGLMLPSGGTLVRGCHTPARFGKPGEARAAGLGLFPLGKQTKGECRSGER